MFFRAFSEKKGASKGWIMTLYNFRTSYGFPVPALNFFVGEGGGGGAGKK